MAPSITSAFATFVQSLAGIGFSLLNAIMGVCHAFLALGQTIFASIVQFGQSVVKLGLDIFQGVFGFVAANFFVILILGGGYYWYTQTQQGRRVKTNLQKRKA